MCLLPTTTISYPLEEATYDWPVVDLVWGCNNDYDAPDVYKQARPPNAYILPVADLVGDWEQELLLRPDLPALRLWVEIRGNPRFASWVPLTDAGGSQYDWAFSGFGLSMSGWIKKVGSPVGAKLRVHVDEGSYQDTTWSNITLADLDKVP